MRRKTRRNRNKKKIETSKVLLIYCDLLTTLVTCVTIIVALRVNDVSPLEFLIPAVFGLTASSHGFYYWKSKAENLHKFGLDRKITGTGENDFYDSDGGGTC